MENEKPEREEPEEQECECEGRSVTCQELRMALLAQDFFLGRIPESERLDAACSIVAWANHAMDSVLEISFAAAGGFWETVNRILGIIWSVASSTPYSVALGVAIAVYYYWNPPQPDKGCKPKKLDKWRHTYVGCKIGFYSGASMTAIIAVLKEVADALGLGTAEVEDIIATLKGVDCGFFESCHACACRHYC